MPANITEIKTTKVDNTTGEIISETEKQQIIKYPKTDDFVMTFTKDLGYMQQLTKGEMLLMFGLFQYVNRENQVILNKGVKELICEKMGLSINTIASMLNSLKKKKMLHGTDKRGIYLLNTHLFGKGSWAEISKMRMLIEWNFEEQTKKVAIEQEFN